MPEASTTTDPAELTRQHYETADRRDFDALMSVYGPDPVWDTSAMGLGIDEGPVAIRRFFEDWIGRYEEWRIGQDEILDLGSGVVFAAVGQNARPAGSTGDVVGLQAMAAGWREWLADWQDFRTDAEGYRELDDERVLAQHGFTGRGKTRGVEVGPTGSKGACLFHVVNGK